jgi:hypothetical protein
MWAMYPSALALHSVLRWAVLLIGLLAVARACAGWPSRRSWTASDNRAGIWFVGALDLQFTVGLLLYVALSPLTQIATENMAATMRDPTLRYWAVEHPVGMVVALVLAHVGRVRIRKASTDDTRHRVAAIFFGLALIAILVSTPWPGTPNARPLFPW